MNVQKPMPAITETRDRERVAPVDRGTMVPNEGHAGAGGSSTRVFLAGVLLLAGGLAFGVWRHSAAQAEVKATAEQRRDLVLSVRVVPVRANDAMLEAKLPGSTEAFEAANIYARTSGYIAKRYVDIGDRVKAGQTLAEITAPELDHQIAQAQANLAQNEAALNQAKANREIANVTWERDSKLLDATPSA